MFTSYLGVASIGLRSGSKKQDRLFLQTPRSWPSCIPETRSFTWTPLKNGNGLWSPHNCALLTLTTRASRYKAMLELNWVILYGPQRHNQIIAAAKICAKMYRLDERLQIFLFVNTSYVNVITSQRTNLWKMQHISWFAFYFSSLCASLLIVEVKIYWFRWFAGEISVDLLRCLITVSKESLPNSIWIMNNSKWRRNVAIHNEDLSYRLLPALKPILRQKVVWSLYSIYV